MSDLIPPLDTKKQSGRPVRNDTQTKGKSYSIYITPAEKKLLDYLHGELNTAYETRIQRLLRDFSNGRNLSADQYLYALEYMDWWCKGSEGAAPKGNPIWEAEIQKQVMKKRDMQERNFRRLLMIFLVRNPEVTRVSRMSWKNLQIQNLVTLVV